MLSRKKNYFFVLGLILLSLSTYSCKEETKEKIIVVTKKETPEVAIDSMSGLKIDKGYELVKQTCMACHSSKLVIQNRATRDGWLTMIRWMQKKHKLWDLGKNESAILDYLAKNYAPDKKGRRPVLKDIDWYELK